MAATKRRYAIIGCAGVSVVASGFAQGVADTNATAALVIGRAQVAVVAAAQLRFEDATALWFATVLCARVIVVASLQNADAHAVVARVRLGAGIAVVARAASQFCPFCHGLVGLADLTAVAATAAFGYADAVDLADGFDRNRPAFATGANVISTWIDVKTAWRAVRLVDAAEVAVARLVFRARILVVTADHARKRADFVVANIASCARIAVRTRHIVGKVLAAQHLVACFISAGISVVFTCNLAADARVILVAVLGGSADIARHAAG